MQGGMSEKEQMHTTEDEGDSDDYDESAEEHSITLII